MCMQMQSSLIWYKIFFPASTLARIFEDMGWNIHDIKHRALNLKTFWHILGNLTRRHLLKMRISVFIMYMGVEALSRHPHALWGTVQHGRCVVRCLLYWLTEARLSLKGFLLPSITECSLRPHHIQNISVIGRKFIFFLWLWRFWK